MATRGVRLLLALAYFVPACAVVLADDTPPDPTADVELLEFLGSVDSGADQTAADDGSWIDYLSQTDIAKVAQKADPNDPARAGQVATGAQAPAAGDKKDE